MLKSHNIPICSLASTHWVRYYAYTTSGYSNRALHALIMKKFCKIWTSWHQTAICWLFGDQLAAHKSAETVKACMDERVMCWLLPANTLHFLQPLDDKIFARFKQVLKSNGKLVGKGSTAAELTATSALYHAAYEAERIAFTDKVIICAFENTGLYPFNLQRIMSLTMDNLGKKEVATKAKYVQAMRKAVEHKLHKPGPKIEMMKGTAWVQATKLFLPYELVEAHEKTKKEKEEKAKMKRKAAEQKKEEALAKRAAQTCGAEGCTTVTRKEGGASGWQKCIHCGMLFCKKHATLYALHVEDCAKSDDEGVGMVAI